LHSAIGTEHFQANFTAVWTSISQAVLNRGAFMRSVIAAVVVLLAAHMAVAAEPTAGGEFSTASNAFAADLFGQLRSQDGNLCISPLSVSTAIAMTAAGARGNTATQMLSVLHWTLPADRLSADSAALTKMVAPVAAAGDASPHAAQRKAPIVRICNSLWGASGIAYEQPFETALQRDFGAELHMLDFAADPEAARKQIDTWASDATNKRIPNAMPAGSIKKSTRLVLVDAVYFKASWADEFKIRSTHELPFHRDGAADATVPMMHQELRLNYTENEHLQMVEIPYIGDFSMVVLLPKKVDGLKEVESEISADTIKPLVSSPTYRMVDLSVPKFKMHGRYELKKSLAVMGMTDACSPAADFSGITTSERLMIDAVSHSTFIAVDEHGTEAAAVTSITMMPTSVFQRPEQPVVFRADHPFLFIIRQNETGAILFMGRVADPSMQS
jgi:serpin B